MATNLIVLGVLNSCSCTVILCLSSCLLVQISSLAFHFHTPLVFFLHCKCEAKLLLLFETTDRITDFGKKTWSNILIGTVIFSHEFIPLLTLKYGEVWNSSCLQRIFWMLIYTVYNFAVNIGFKVIAHIHIHTIIILTLKICMGKSFQKCGNVSAAHHKICPPHLQQLATVFRSMSPNLHI